MSRAGVQRGQHALGCAGCGAECADDVEYHEYDDGHTLALCPACAVLTCDGCRADERMREAALRREPNLAVRLADNEVMTQVMVATARRRNERLDHRMRARSSDVTQTFMRLPLPCVRAGCGDLLRYVEGSDRWPGEAELRQVPDALVWFSRRCDACGAEATGSVGELHVADARKGRAS